MDVRVQKVAEEALVGKRGSVVALDPKTGDVIALASTPGFDPNDFVRGLSVAQYAALSNNIDVPLLNRALRRVSAGLDGEAPVRIGGAALRNFDSGTCRILPRLLYVAGQQQQVPRRQDSWILGYAARDIRVLRCIFLSARRQDGHRSYARFHECVWLRRIDGNRYSGGKARLVCLARMETTGVQAQGRSGVVSRRKHQHGHRPGSHHGHTAAAGALCGGNRRARGKSSPRLDWSRPLAHPVR